MKVRRRLINRLTHLEALLHQQERVRILKAQNNIQQQSALISTLSNILQLSDNAHLGNTAVKAANGLQQQNQSRFRWFLYDHLSRCQRINKQQLEQLSTMATNAKSRQQRLTALHRLKL